jgi:nicotinamide riboside transporter PnuC
MIEFIGTVSTILAIIGVILNNQKLWPCFVLWIFSNALTGWIHYRKRVWSLLARDIVFLALAIQGLWMWTR